MPWTEADVDRFHKGLSDKQKRQWVHIANGVLAKGGSEKSAIMQANGTVGRESSVSEAIDAEMAAYREASDEHFYGSWSGGAKGSGGRPGGGGDDAWGGVTKAPGFDPGEHMQVGKHVHIAYKNDAGNRFAANGRIAALDGPKMTLYTDGGTATFDAKNITSISRQFDARKGEFKD